LIKTRDTDRLIIVSSLVLVALGVLMVYSTSYIVAMKRFGDEYFFVKKHLTYAIAGIVLFIAATRLKYKVYGKLAYPALALAAVLLVLIYVPGFGFEAGGARRWVRLGPVAFQP